MELGSRARLAAAAAMAAADPPEAPPPAHSIAARSASWGLSVQLKPHQIQGVSWLIKCYIRGINVILGDEMGLGKTLQAITLISYLKFERGISGPFLILCPLSVIDGWSSEFLQHAPKLQIVRYIGNKEERTALSKKICNFINNQSAALWEDPDLPFDVLLTTYDLAMVDVAFLSRFRWRYSIIDEAQRLKNSSAVLYKTLESSYMIPRRLLLTGTPIQNNLTELWALLHFCMPQVFNNLEDFLMTFPINNPHGSYEGNEELNLLKSILNVFMLRRTKSALVQNKTLVLPSLSEVTILARPVPLQKNVYLSVLKKELPKLLQKHGVVAPTSLQNIVVQLRKACSHPYLFDGVEPEPYEEGEHLIQASGKLMVLDSFLRELFIKKHRVLIYAQMTRTLDILQDYLEFRGYLYERLDGSVRAEERFAAARKFNAGSIGSENRGGFADSMTPFVFLLTTRAGGVGLNLTAADTVIFYEQDWNPQADKQAVQRAHRIGQINPVLAINLVTENTVDEVILSRAKKKLKLTNDIIGSSTLDPDCDVLDTAKPSDLHSMIIFGLDKLHSSTIESASEDEVMPQMTQLIQEALKQRGKNDSGAWGNENRISDQELEENLYAFEGRDFTPKKRKDCDEMDSHQPTDQAVLDSFIQKLENASDQDLSERRGRKRSIDDTKTLDEDRAAKQQKAELKKTAKWESLGYKSLAVHDPGDVLGDLQTEDDESKVHFVFGDCTKPLVGSNETAVIFSIVDDSGVWGSGGMFSALNRLSVLVQEAYEAAHTAGDLHVGDLHLLSLDGAHDKAQQSQVAATDQGTCRFWVGLGVVQRFDRRQKPARSDISLPALEACLRKVTSSAAAMSASIHMPRISSRPGQDRKEWYAIERLLRKHANRSGVQIFVYYYKHSDKDQ